MDGRSRAPGFSPGFLRRGIPRLVFLAAAAVCAAVPISGYEPQPIPREELEGFRAPVIILGDAETGTVLAERNPGMRLPPASLAKLMTLHLSLADSETGRLDRDGVYSVPPEGTAAAMRWGSSVLGLEDGNRATMLTLRRAAATVSANDAAWTLASLSSGGRVADFVARMNAEAASLGMQDTVYTDPDGWSSLSTTTGRDQWILARAYLAAHSEELGKLHSIPVMAYRDEDSLSSMPERRNTNLLIGRFPGADGLKTGTIPSAGFHFIATARRDGTRLIAVVMGIRPESSIEGLRLRAREAAALLELGFAEYETWRPPESAAVTVPVLHGAAMEVEAIPDSLPRPVTLEKGDSARITTVLTLPDNLTAPVAEGAPIGAEAWAVDGRTIAEAPLVAGAAVERRWRLKHSSAFRALRRTRN